MELSGIICNFVTMKYKGNNKISHQVRISEHEAEIIMLSLYWFARWCPEYRKDASFYFDVFNRVYHIIKQKKLCV